MHEAIVDNVVVEQFVVPTGLPGAFTPEDDRKGLLEIMKDYVVFDFGAFLELKIKPMDGCIGEVE
jgi:hypothetical protein